MFFVTTGAPPPPPPHTPHPTHTTPTPPPPPPPPFPQIPPRHHHRAGAQPGMVPDDDLAPDCSELRVPQIMRKGQQVGFRGNIHVCADCETPPPVQVASAVDDRRVG